VTEPGPAASPGEQLAALGSLAALLDQHGIPYWVFGGWAVDFCVGTVTRHHDDIDLAAWRHDEGRISSVVEAAGWQRVPHPHDMLGTRYRRGRVLVEVTFVVADDAGRVVVWMPAGPVVWSARPFGDERRELYGVTCRTIPLRLLRAGKARPRDDAADAAKDRADHAALSRLDD
jgi:hypothetical protein